MICGFKKQDILQFCSVLKTHLVISFFSAPVPLLLHFKTHKSLAAGTYRFAVALDTMHDAKGFSQIWVPCVLQRVKATSKCTSCKKQKTKKTTLNKSGRCTRPCFQGDDHTGAIAVFPKTRLQSEAGFMMLVSRFNCKLTSASRHFQI